MSELLERAFSALGPEPTWRELELVAEALRDAEDDEALDVLAAAWGDREASDALTELAQASGSSGLVALDLQVEVFKTGGNHALPPAARIARRP